VHRYRVKNAPAISVATSSWPQIFVVMKAAKVNTAPFRLDCDSFAGGKLCAAMKDFAATA